VLAYFLGAVETLRNDSDAEKLLAETGIVAG